MSDRIFHLRGRPGRSNKLTTIVKNILRRRKSPSRSPPAAGRRALSLSRCSSDSGEYGENFSLCSGPRPIPDDWEFSSGEEYENTRWRDSPTPSNFHSVPLIIPPYDPDNPYVPPINRLPTEVLALIFAYSHGGMRDSCNLDEFVPITITHVCSLWHDIAVDLSHLWKRFNLRTCVMKGGEHRQANLAALCLKRSGGGVSIAYKEVIKRTRSDTFGGYARRWHNDSSGSLPGDARTCHCVFDFIINNLASVRELYLSVGRDSIDMLSRRRCASTSLEILDVAFLFGNIGEKEARRIARLYSTPSLRVLRWSYHVYGRGRQLLSRAPLDAPWQTLQSVDLRDSPITHLDFMHILRSSPSLRELHVNTFRPRSSDESTPSIEHYSLRTLHVEAHRKAGPLDDIFSVTTLPNLRVFSLRTDFAQGIDDWPLLDSNVFLKFLSRIRMGLESFYLESCNLDESTFVNCLRLPQMSTITRLSATDLLDDFTKRTISFLTPDDQKDHVLPHLKALCLRDCVTARDGRVARMLQTRDAYGIGIVDAEVQFAYGEKHELDDEALKEHADLELRSYFESCFFRHFCDQ